MWDLTVTGDHDFYVQVGIAAVLVHNCDVRMTQRQAGTLSVGPHGGASVPATGRWLRRHNAKQCRDSIAIRVAPMARE